MAEDPFNYHEMLGRAVRGVMREALARAAQSGLSGGHYFYLTFHTRAPGVELPDFLLAKYPDLMTIVLQHQFWGLDVRESAVSVTLSFNNRLERLAVPFDAVTAFADPSVKFALQFEVPDTEKRAGLPASAPESSPEKPERPPERGGAEVVALDKFRKR